MNACQDLAHAIVLGEIPEGFGKVVFALRTKVKKEIIKTLCYDTKETEFIEQLVQFYSFEKLLPLLEFSDEELIGCGAQDAAEDSSIVEMLEGGRSADGFILTDRVLDRLGEENRVDWEDEQSVIEAIVTVIFKARKELSRTGADQRLISAQRILIVKDHVGNPAPKTKTVAKLRVVRN